MQVYVLFVLVLCRDQVEIVNAFCWKPKLSILRFCDTSLRTVEGQSNIPSVPVTPCTRICRYNANVFDGKVCIGCFRETYEIGAWGSMSPREKYYALLDASERLEEVADGSTIDELATGTSRQELLRQADYWNSVAAQNR